MRPTPLVSTLLSFLASVIFLTPVTTSAAIAADCPRAPVFTSSALEQWQGWGNGHANTRFASDGIASADLATLELRWTFGFPGVGSVIGNPVVHEDVVFIGVDSGEVYALDAETACVHWVYQADNGVRTAPVLAFIEGDWLLFFGDRSAQVYGVDAATGRQLWKVAVDGHPAAIITGSPQAVHLPGEEVPHRLIVPVSSSEEGLAAVPGYACCSFRGSVVGLDALTGTPLWKRHTIGAEVQDTGNNSKGPSGAAIWSPPTVSVGTGQIFVTTGDAYSAPADEATDAVIALNLFDGSVQWISQGTADDIWTVRCMTPQAPEDCGPDQDYGSPAMLLTLGDDRFLVAGQKSGYVRAFDLDDGALRWRTALVENTEEFGGKIVWGGASDGRRAYFGLGTGGIAAVDISDGNLAWFTPLSPSADRQNHAGQDGPLTASADLVFSGGWDGVLRALSSASGELLWEFDTAVEYSTANGVVANGGSMGAAAPVMAGKRLFVPTGYVGVKNGMPGNALLMFSP